MTSGRLNGRLLHPVNSPEGTHWSRPHKCSFPSTYSSLGYAAVYSSDGHFHTQNLYPGTVWECNCGQKYRLVRTNWFKRKLCFIEVKWKKINIELTEIQE
jgi:hypothetical protein